MRVRPWDRPVGHLDPVGCRSGRRGPPLRQTSTRLAAADVLDGDSRPAGGGATSLDGAWSLPSVLPSRRGSPSSGDRQATRSRTAATGPGRPSRCPGNWTLQGRRPTNDGERRPASVHSTCRCRSPARRLTLPESGADRRVPADAEDRRQTWPASAIGGSSCTWAAPRVFTRSTSTASSPATAPIQSSRRANTT